MKMTQVFGCCADAAVRASGRSLRHVEFGLNRAFGLGLTMTKFMIGSVAAALTLLPGPALVQAADLPARTAPPVYTAPILVSSWGGFYAGSTFGYGFTTFNTKQ